MSGDNHYFSFDELKEVANSVFKDAISPGQFRMMFDKISESRAQFEEWLGDESKEYQLSNGLMVLSRSIKAPADSSSIKLSDVINSSDLLKEWVCSIRSLI